jgi:hypothetical protein
MTFSLSDNHCSLTPIITVNDRKDPAYGFRAKVARVKYKRHGTEIEPSVWADARTREEAIGKLFLKLYRIM